MKNVEKILTSVLMLSAIGISACETCQTRQPEITKNLTHGAGPESDWDWFIVGIVMLITLVAFYYTVKYLVKPGERNKDHIKHSFLQ